MKFALRIVGMILLLILMVGFGMCGLLGLSFGLGGEAGTENGMILLLAVAGLTICGLSAWLAFKLFRQIKANPPGA